MVNQRCLRPAAGGTLLVALLALGSTCARAADTASALTDEQQEVFLRTAKIVSSKPAKKGTTDSIRATLSDGKLTHDAHVQTIDEHKTMFKGESGTVEMNFKDTYGFNIAASKLARILGIGDMVPVSVARSFRGQNASFTWWIDNYMTDEEERLGKKQQAPDQTNWAKEVNVMHVFDQLIYNTDSNATNLLYDTQWRAWFIDHTRSFRMQKTLQDVKMLTQCDRSLLAKMKTLDEAQLEKELKPYVNKEEIRGLLARRDLIVKFFEAKGESGLYDRPVRH